jgi:hypothetical protein
MLLDETGSMNFLKLQGELSQEERDSVSFNRVGQQDRHKDRANETIKAAMLSQSPESVPLAERQRATDVLLDSQTLRHGHERDERLIDQVKQIQLQLQSMKQ